MMRIQKFVAESGICSRRAAEELVREGRITVNGKPAEIGMDVDPIADSVYCDGKRIRPRAAEKRYFIFYKPRGVITAMKAQDDRSVVADLIKGIKGRVYPVGRLDRDSEGLLILTDDGDLAQRLTHPSHAVPKTYRVTVRGEVSLDQLNRFREGVFSTTEKKRSLPASRFRRSRKGRRCFTSPSPKGKTVKSAGSVRFWAWRSCFSSGSPRAPCPSDIWSRANTVPCRKRRRKHS